MTERSTLPVLFTVPSPFCGHNPNQAYAGFYDLAALLNEALRPQGWHIDVAKCQRLYRAQRRAQQISVVSAAKATGRNRKATEGAQPGGHRCKAGAPRTSFVSALRAQQKSPHVEAIEARYR